MQNNINLVQEPSIIRRKKYRKRNGFIRRFLKLLLYIFVAFFVVSFILSSKAIFSQATLGSALSKLPIVSQVRTILGKDSGLVEKDEDRVNFLLLGIGGNGHDGGLLTDTIMLASVQLSTKQAVLISIPRDLYAKIPGNGYQRINNASAYGDLNNYEGGGSALLAKTIEDVLGIPIHYYLRVDFNGFKEVIDTLGGIDIYVDNGFTDNNYPDENYGVQTITFAEGYVQMDGATALQFARSRHGNNGEGSDFARSKRQQKIIMAIKDKMLNLNMLTKPAKIYNILDSIKKHIQTNVNAWNLPQLLSLAREIDFKNIKHQVIDDSPGGLLKPMTTDEGAFVLVPKSGDLNELKYFARNIFTIKEIADNNIKVIVVNGTKEEGLATYIGSILQSWGFNIARLTNAPQQDFEKTVIYDLTQGNSGEALKILRSKIDANTTEKVPAFLQPVLYKNSDMSLEENKIEASFLVVAGEDQKEAIEEVKKWYAEQARLEAIESKREVIEEDLEQKNEPQE